MFAKRGLIRAGVLTLAMGTCFAAGVFAKDALEKVEAYLRPDFKVELDGHRVITETPLIYNGSSYLPFKQIANLLGAEAAWDEATKTIKVTRPEPPNPGPSAPSGGTNAPGQTPSGGGGQTTPTDHVVDEEIVLKQLMKYNFKYNNTDYPVLTNTYNGALYVRWSDVKKMPFNFGILRLSKEKLTGEQYVHLEQIRPIMGDQVRGDLREYAIVESGSVDTSKLKALNEYFGEFETGFTIKPLAEEDMYSVLAKTSTGTYRQYSLRFTKRYDGTWFVSSTGWTSYPTE